MSIEGFFIEKRRDITEKLRLLANQFPAVALLGPRQSGKTTLSKTTFSNYLYFSFEDPDIRELARLDARGFLNRYKDAPGIIFDEVQHVPDLLSYIQTHIDQYRKIGHFILTGSHNLLLNQAISQSLAGRIAILTLLPLSIHEISQANLLPDTLDHAIFNGFYPAIYHGKPSPTDWYASYINTYVERDVRQVKNVTNLNMFQRFLKLCAGRVGQILNLSSLSNDLGLSSHTIKEWLSVLEASYIIFLLEPYYQNFSKRVIKSPKIYFYDTGILCSLLSIRYMDQLFTHHLRGNIFESLIVSDFRKQFYNTGFNPECYFWRDKTDYKIDCIVQKASRLIPIEIKASQVFNKNFLENLSKWNEFAKTKKENNVLVYGGDINQKSSLGKVVSWKTAGTLIQSL